MTTLNASPPQTPQNNKNVPMRLHSAGEAALLKPRKYNLLKNKPQHITLSFPANDHRILRNDLKGIFGNKFNVILAARLISRKYSEHFLFNFFFLLQLIWNKKQA